MIPDSLRQAWNRLDMATTPALAPEIEPPSHDHDLILRYAVVGIFVILGTAALYVSKTIMMPVLSGMILGLVLGPVVDRLVRLGLPQSAASGLLVVSAMMALGTAVSLLAAPFALWSDKLPSMLAALKDRLSGLMMMARRLEGMVGELSPVAAPKVSLADSSPLMDAALNSTAVFSGVFICMATVYFYLATRRHLKAQMLRLCLGRHARHYAGEFFADVEQRIAMYFGVVTLINLGMGFVATMLAWAAGLPFPIFWGSMAFLLNYVAFIGPIIVTVLFVAGGLIGENTHWGALWPGVAFFLIHLVEGNVVTPIAVGRRLTVSPFYVFISFVFWLWLWGPVGAILSTPLLLVVSVAMEARSAYHVAAIEADTPPETEGAIILPVAQEPKSESRPEYQPESKAWV